MNELALFAGAGGGILGARLLGWRTVCAVEVNPYCREVLLRRQEEGSLGAFPIWDDVRTFDGKPWRGAVDIISAGFPCQPYSVAGKHEGEDDERNLWPDTIRIIREVGPDYALLENVPGLLAHEYFGTILGDLAESGYDARWRMLSAAELGATHRRDRLWIVANAHDARLQGRVGKGKSDAPRTKRAPACREPVRSVRGFGPPRPTQVGEIPRMVDDVARRMERHVACGQGQVPAVVRAAWELLTS